jgi:hypothetical protein
MATPTIASALDDRVATGKARKHSDQQVEQVRLCARQDFRRLGLQRAERDDHDGYQQCHHEADAERHDATLRLPVVDRGQRKAQRHDRPHQRRDQHGADDHGDRVLQQPEDGDATGKDRHQRKTRGEVSALVDAFHNLRMPDALGGARPEVAHAAPGQSDTGQKLTTQLIHVHENSLRPGASRRALNRPQYPAGEHDGGRLYPLRRRSATGYGQQRTFVG